MITRRLATAHFNAMEQDAVQGRRGEPWVWVDTRTGTQLPLSYRGWRGTYDPRHLGISEWEFVLQFGRHMPGGGPGEQTTAAVPPNAKPKPSRRLPRETGRKGQIQEERGPLGRFRAAAYRLHGLPQRGYELQPGGLARSDCQAELRLGVDGRSGTRHDPGRRDPSCPTALIRPSRAMQLRAQASQDDLFAPVA